MSHGGLQMLPGRPLFTRQALFHGRHRDREYQNLGTERGLGLRKKRVFGWQDGDHDHLPRAERSVLFTWLLLREVTCDLWVGAVFRRMV